MQLNHRFTVPATKAETWDAFNDIESVAGCFPGAAVTAVEGDDFTGSCKVKLGPIALVYNGSGSFVEKDEAAGRFVIDAKGKDKRGNGTAGAHVTAVLTESGAETDIEVVTDLSITGKPAQFGRGVMQDVSDKLLTQFVECLAGRLAAPAEAGSAAAAPEAGAAPPESGGRGAEAAAPAAAAAPEAAGAGTAESAAGEVGAAPGKPVETPLGEASSAAAGPGGAVGGGDVGAGGWSAGSRGGAAPEPQEALDLGATVLPVLVKSYWKQALGVVLVLLVLRRLLRRRS